MLNKGDTVKFAKEMRDVLKKEFGRLGVDPLPEVVCAVFSNRPSSLDSTNVADGTVVVTKAQ